MDFIKQWALGLVVAAVCGTVVLALTPQGALEKQVRTAVSLFLLIAFIYPFVSNVDFADIFSNTDAEITLPESDVGPELFKEEIKKETESEVVESLERKGINVKDINIDITVGESNEVCIDKVYVVISNSSEAQTAEEVLKEELGIVAEVEVE